MNRTHHLILTTRILGAFQYAAMSVGNGGAGICGVTPGDSMGARDVVTNGRNGFMCPHYKSLLEAES